MNTYIIKVVNGLDAVVYDELYLAKNANEAMEQLLLDVILYDDDKIIIGG